MGGEGGGGSGRSDHGGTAPPPLPWSCSDEALLKLIASRDPNGVGESDNTWCDTWSNNCHCCRMIIHC
jgi:hypothetical protein